MVVLPASTVATVSVSGGEVMKSTTHEKDTLREQIDQQVADFVASGGKIQKLPASARGTKKSRRFIRKQLVLPGSNPPKPGTKRAFV